MRTILYVLSSLFIASSFAFAGISPQRLPHESFETLQKRLEWNDFLGMNSPTSVSKSRKPLEKINLLLIPEMPSYEALVEEFHYVRDTRFIATSNPDFPRRLSWLYPDDGCYARAEFSRRKLAEHGALQPMKIFVFGNLIAQTPNTLSGVVSWWYHVAVTYRVGDDVYVFDASINPSRPMTLTEWNDAVGGNRQRFEYSLCAPGAYDPAYDCHNPREIHPSKLSMDQTEFLRPEWDRLLRLNRSPEKELGDLPPWLNN